MTTLNETQLASDIAREVLELFQVQQDELDAMSPEQMMGLAAVYVDVSDPNSRSDLLQVSFEGNMSIDTIREEFNQIAMTTQEAGVEVDLDKVGITPEKVYDELQEDGGYYATYLQRQQLENGEFTEEGDVTVFADLDGQMHIDYAEKSFSVEEMSAIRERAYDIAGNGVEEMVRRIKDVEVSSATSVDRIQDGPENTGTVLVQASSQVESDSLEVSEASNIAPVAPPKL